jgi:hypothetical protein
MTEILITPTAPIQLGNLTLFELTFVDQAGAAIDLSAGSAFAIKFQTPQGVTSTETAALSGDGTDGKIRATFAPTAAGAWRIQGRATLAGLEKHSSKAIFPVESNL